MREVVLRFVVFAAVATAAFNADAVLSMAGLEHSQSGREVGRSILQSLAWLSGAIVAISAVNRFFWDGVVARIARRPVPNLLKKAFAIVVLVAASTGIVGIVFDRDVTAIWATSGVVGLVLGLALRNMIQDLFTGIALNLDGAIKAGDWVELHHRDFLEVHYGKVVDITWRTSRIQLENNNILVVPNSLMGMMAVTNFAHGDHVTRLETNVVINFDVAPERARRILLAGARAAAGRSGILESPPPSVIIGDPVERGVSYTIRFWGRVSEQSPTVMQDAVMTSLLGHLRVAGLTPAYPKEDVFHARLPRRLLDHEQPEDRVEVLSRIALFGKALSGAEIARLASTIAVRSYLAGDRLVRQGEPGESMFVVVEGALDVVVDHDGDGRQLRVGRIGPGEIFGEMSLLTGEKRSASVIAETGVLAYEITRADFEAILAGRAEIAEQISAIVADRRLATDQAMRDASAEDVQRERSKLNTHILSRMRALFAWGPGPRGKASAEQPAAGTA